MIRKNNKIYIIAFLFLILYSFIFYIYLEYIQLQYLQNILSNSELLSKKLYIILILIFLSITTLFVAKYTEKIIMKKQKKEQSYITQLEDINKFYNLLQNCNNLKSVSTISIEFITNQFNAKSGLIYLTNFKNLKLLLLDGYNLNLNKTSKVLDLYHGLSGEAFSTKKIKTYYKNNLTYCAIPLITNNTVVGIIQLHFESYLHNIISNNYQQTMLTIVSDTLLKNLEHSKNEKYLDLIDKYVLISSTNTNGDIIYVSDAFCQATGYTKKEFLGNSHRILRDSNNSNELYKEMWSTIRSGKVWHKELSNIKKDGSIYWADTTISPRYDLYKNIIGYDAIRTDITHKKKIELLSITDSLTSLHNRRYFDKLFPAQLKLSNRTDEKLALLMIDIDHFKQYNDTYGHQEGDTTLQKVAITIQSFAKRENDYAFRIGGEEFAMLFFIKNEHDILKIATKLNNSIEENKIVHKTNSASKYVTISIGLFICNDQLSANEIYKETDKLLYKAKQQGRNQVVSNITGENG